MYWWVCDIMFATSRVLSLNDWALYLMTSISCKFLKKRAILEEPFSGFVFCKL